MALVGLAEVAMLATVIQDVQHFYYLIYIAFYCPAIALMIVCFLPRIRMGIAPGTPSQVLSTMSLNFRIAQYRVIDKGRSFVVQGGTNHGIRIYAESSGSDSVVLVRSDPTPSGWGVLMILFIFTYGLLTIPYSIYLFYKSQKFGLSVIPAMYKKPGETIGSGVTSKTKACLIDTLSEGYRLSSEAYESAKSNFEDLIIVATLVGVVGGLAAFALVVIAMMGMNQDSVSTAEILIATVLGLVTGVGVPLVAYFQLRKAARPKLLSLREWADKLKEELTREATSSGPQDRQTSTFELILDAYRQLPSWLQIRHKSGVYRNPVLWMAILLMAMYGLTYLLAALISSWEDVSWRLILGAASTGFIVLSIGMYFYWRRTEAAEARKVSEAWQHRTESIQHKMDEIVKDL